MPIPPACIVAVLLLPAVPAAAQSLRWWNEPRIDQPEAAVYDAVHGHTLWARAAGEPARLYEWDGAAAREWLPAPGVVTTVHWLGIDPLDGRRLLLGRDATTTYVGTSDGGAWRWQTTSRTFDADTRFAYDAQRRRLVALRTGLNTMLTIEFDGTTWTQSIGGLPLRWTPGLAYDPVGQRCVAYGGSGTTGPLADCWTWDGVAWTQIATAAAPGPRIDPGMGHFSGRNGLVLYGNESGATTTWLLSGNTWVQIQTAHDPGGHRHPSLVQDPNGSLLLLPSANDLSGDAWRFTGSDWVPVPELTAPTFRGAAGFAFDPLRGQVVVHGGTAVPDRITMLYDTRWRAVAPVHTPGARNAPYLAWSQIDGQVLLLGGSGAGGQPQSDTWSWDGSDWNARTPAASPPPRVGAVFCSDPHGGVMLFGGFHGAALRNDHWRWDGATWTQLAPPLAPPPQVGAAAALDPMRNRVVLVGLGPQSGIGTWEWDGVAWTPMQPAVQPAMGPVGFDPRRGRVVIGSNVGFHEWDGTDWNPLPAVGVTPPVLVTDTSNGQLLATANQSVTRFQRLVARAPDVTATLTGCALGKAPVLAITDEPRLGRIAAFELRDATPAAVTVVAVGLRAIQQPLGPCTLHVDAVVDWLWEFADPAGSARRAVAIPPASALRGITLVAQGFVYDPAQSPIGSVTFTAALAIVVGD